MTCHYYKQAILELAARGPETKPDPKLEAHLQACSSCRSAFENERSLFASIDSCLAVGTTSTTVSADGNVHETSPAFMPGRNGV